MNRKPAVAGQFYPAEPQRLTRLIASLRPDPAPAQEKTIACVLPHAGYVYSGRVAAAVIARLDPFDICVILGPNHTGLGAACSLMSRGEWQTPLGTISVDTELARHLLSLSKYLKDDSQAHLYEHSIEVQLPLLQAIANRDFSLVPIVLAPGDDLMYKDIALALAAGVKACRKKVLLIASSDMTHYEAQARAEKKDRQAIAAILRLDPQALTQEIDRLDISMCGAGPVRIVMEAAKELGADRGQLIDYRTSGEETGDLSSVVGYAGVLIR